MEDTVKSMLKWLKDHEQTVSMALGAAVILILGYYLVNRVNQPTTPVITDEGTSIETPENVTYEQTEEGIVPQNLPAKHTVQAGDILWAISQKYYGSGFNWVDIASANELQNANVLSEGMELELPKVRVRVPAGIDPDSFVAGATTEATPEPLTSTPDTYTVVKGDSLWTIAQSIYNDGYKWNDIYEANMEMIKSPHVIEAGWELKIPKSTS